jgi:hypothetical protein
MRDGRARGTRLRSARYAGDRADCSDCGGIVIGVGGEARKVRLDGEWRALFQ